MTVDYHKEINAPAVALHWPTKKDTRKRCKYRLDCDRRCDLFRHRFKNRTSRTLEQDDQCAHKFVDHRAHYVNSSCIGRTRSDFLARDSEDHRVSVL